jgi:hypothetical protein
VLPVIIAFDPELPIIVATTMKIGGRSFADGDAFPWRELGLDVLTLHSFYRSGYVRCLATPAESPRPGEQPSKRKR